MLSGPNVCNLDRLRCIVPVADYACPGDMHIELLASGGVLPESLNGKLPMTDVANMRAWLRDSDSMVADSARRFIEAVDSGGRGTPTDVRESATAMFVPGEDYGDHIYSLFNHYRCSPLLDTRSARMVNLSLSVREILLLKHIIDGCLRA